MSAVIEKKRQAIIRKVIALINQNLEKEKAVLLVKFTKLYFALVSYEDLSERKPEDLYGGLMSHWSLLYERKPNTAKVRVYNPAKDQHGWQSTHTIVEISHDDMPFLVDSVRMEINRCGFLIHFVIHLGGIHVERNAKHQVSSVSAKDQSDSKLTEAPIYIEIDRQTDQTVLKQLQKNLLRILGDVSVAVHDWLDMRESMNHALLELEQTPPPLDKAEIAEAKDFLRWLNADNFTFLGCRDYELVEKNNDQFLEAIKGTGLGVLRETKQASVRHLSDLPQEAREMTLSSHILIFAKTRTRSTVHRPAYTDYIGVKKFDSKGKFIGERRFIGLYTSTAYNSSPGAIPFLRHKVAKVIKKSALDPRSHSGKSMLNILETLPRDDLFQATAEELLELGLGILHLQDRQRIRMFVRKDSYGRFFSCLVFVPRRKFTSQLCEKMQVILQKAFQAQEASYEPLLSESMLVCVHFVMRVDSHQTIEYDLDEVERQLVVAGSSWRDELKIALIKRFGEAQGIMTFNQYCDAFPAGYREQVSAEEAVMDIEHIESLSDEYSLDMNFYDPHDSRGYVRFKVFQCDHTIPLSDALPVLENMGMRVIGERPHRIVLHTGQQVWINDFDLLHDGREAVEIDHSKRHFQEAFAAIWLKRADNDRFNVLVVKASLNWHEVTMLRAYMRYSKQLGSQYGDVYVAEILESYPHITRLLVDLFRARFDPDIKRSDATVERIAESIIKALDKVVYSDHDKVFRGYLELIQATLRTNYFQRDTEKHSKPYLSFKINPAAIQEMPLPKPMYEIFVYSARFEGCHLRGGKVARGGLRWSNRPEDFRTEVLGLMKAQQVKNACIVPNGAKGGFVPKAIPKSASRDQIMEEGVACYRMFVRAMLDLTDNYKGKKVVPPKRVVSYDEADPYLVVAADKGTATFSDIANEISGEYDFWLGDAFASGGSRGYDHKKMGITARGAWESVKRHFREMGRDIQNEEFTAIGIGDMAGDVFGNGLMLSPKTKLVAAFNHMHIFVDPNPNPEKSLKERQRLFNLPRSTWEDYNPKLISEGGGVFNRSDKLIRVSPEMRAIFAIKKDYVVPNELIRHILTMEVDLLWNGGIGTFVKASTQSEMEIRDKSNEVIRVDANQLHCKVVGEGGNLGFTQLARVEYELHGGRVYTDFIDNAAGVDCSDHEVNIKILLNAVMKKGELSQDQRDQLLLEMTDEVAELVLKNNYQQTQALSLISIKAGENLDLYARYMRELAEHGKINLELEFLPSEKTLIDRKAAGHSLTRPELAVLFAYSKMILKDQILHSDVPEDPYLSKMLRREFPMPLQERYESEMKSHILRREIIATQLSNTLINELGFTFIPRLQEETGASVEKVVRAFTIAHKIFGKQSLWQAIERLDYKVSAAVQFEMMRSTNRLIRRATRWLLRNRRDELDIDSTVSYYAKPVAVLANNLMEWLPEEHKEHFLRRVEAYVAEGVPEKLAMRVVGCRVMFSALDIVEAALEYDWRLADVARTYGAIGQAIGLDWLRLEIHNFKPADVWEALTRTALRDDLDWWQRMLTVVVLQQEKRRKTIQDKVEQWVASNQVSLTRWQGVIARVKASAGLHVVMFSILMRELSDLVQVNI